MAGLDHYNGYSGKERMEKFVEMKRRIDCNELSKPSGPCALCDEPSGLFEYHDEDYSQPYDWTNPAAYVLCHHCHIQKIHARFRSPHRWLAFIELVSQGVHSSDLYGKQADAKNREKFETRCSQIKRDLFAEVSRWHEDANVPGQEWFYYLSLDPTSRENRTFRPRP